MIRLLAEAIWFASQYILQRSLARLGCASSAESAQPSVQVCKSLAPLSLPSQAMAAFALYTSSLTASKAAFAGKNVKGASTARPQVTRTKSDPGRQQQLHGRHRKRVRRCRRSEQASSLRLALDLTGHYGCQAAKSLST